MKLLHFFEYCFYRCVSSKFNQKLDKEEYLDIAPSVWITLCQTCNITTLITIFYILVDTKFDFEIVIPSICIPLFLINTLFLLTRKKYEALKIRYKDEKNKKLRGWGVVSYIILSFSIWIIVSVKLFWVPKTGWH